MKRKGKRVWIIAAGILILAVVVLISCVVMAGGKKRRMNECLQLGNRYLLEEEYEKAIVEFAKVIGIDPKNVEATYYLSEAYFGLAQVKVENREELLERAATYSKKVMDLVQSGDAYYQMAEDLIEQVEIERKQEEPRQEEELPQNEETRQDEGPQQAEGDELLKIYARECLEREQDLSDYHETNYIIPQEGTEWKSTSMGNGLELEDYGYSGILSMGIYDFDKNGQNELLIIRMIQMPPTEKYTCIVSGVEASMYQVKDGQVVEMDRVILTDEVLIIFNIIQMDIFVKNMADGVYLFHEENAAVFLTGDGAAWNFKAVKYQDDQFVEIASRQFGGSVWEPEDSLELTRMVQNTGLVVSDVMKREGGSPRIVEQDPAIVVLGAGVREVVNEDVFDRVLMPGERLEYAYTEFKNLAPKDLMLVLPPPSEMPVVETESAAPLVQKSEAELHSLLVAYYANDPDEVTVWEGTIENGLYNCHVRCGVPGNPDASQWLYDVNVDVATGYVTEENVLVGGVKHYQLYD